MVLLGGGGGGGGGSGGRWVVGGGGGGGGNLAWLGTEERCRGEFVMGRVKQIHGEIWLLGLQFCLILDTHLSWSRVKT